MSELQQAINEMRNMRESYDLLAAAQASLAENVQVIKDAHILEFSIGGVTFSGDYTPVSLADALTHRDKVVTIDDDKIIKIGKYIGTDFPELVYFKATEASEIVRNAFYPNSIIQTIIAPNIQNFGIDCLAILSSCKLLDLTYSPFFGGSAGQGSPNLICLKIGAGFTSSESLSLWNPTVALLTTDNDLVTDNEDEFGNPITNNREQLLYNIRQYIAANLPDRTDDTPFTITFSQTLRDAFDQATEDAFAAKNWDIAPARS